jgi:hypothetical protein
MILSSVRKANKLYPNKGKTIEKITHESEEETAGANKP